MGQTAKPPPGRAADAAVVGCPLAAHLASRLPGVHPRHRVRWVCHGQIVLSGSAMADRVERGGGPKCRH